MSAIEPGDERLPQRFWDKVAIADDGCWLWMAACVPNGYGQFRFTGRMMLAHRVAYAVLVGDLPEWVPSGVEVDHLCRVRTCVNPAHMELVTHRVNTLRGETVAGKQSRQTQCLRGHQLSGTNVRETPLARGNRQCRTCGRERSRGHAAAIRAAYTALGITRDEYSRMFGQSRAVAAAIVGGTQ